MKTICAILLIFLFSANAHGQYTDIPYNTDQILPSNRILTNLIATEKQYAVVFGNKGVKDSVLLSTKQYAYNPAHQLMRWDLKIEGNKTKISRKYYYSQYNTLLKYVDITSNAGLKAGKIDSLTYLLQYDTLGNIRFIFRFGRDTLNLQTTQMMYNSQKQLISMMHKVNEGEYLTDKAIIYNENGDLAGLYYLDVHGNEIASYSFDYDYPNKKRQVFKAGKKLYEVYTYNLNKDCIKKEHFNDVAYTDIKNAVPLETTKYYYDDNGLLGNEVTYTGSALTSFIKHIYSK